ncbi:MAG: preprotein translocase subunit SecY [Eubacterium sp.]|nr:preprotein translocase subunit SecY [Eubacterium sp.]
MLQTLRSAFKVQEIRERLVYTFFMLIVIRLGSQLPCPGIDSALFAEWFSSQTNGAFNFFDAITGGSFNEMSVFALSITPYITSSIIMQLLTIAIPKLEEMQRDGEDGRKKIAGITRYVTVALALIESIAMAIGFSRMGYLTNDGVFTIIQIVCILTAGSAVLMWIGEQITEKGVGNGISIVLVINIVSRIPADMFTLYEQFVKNQKIARGVLAAVVILAIILLTVIFVIVLQDAERKIPVQYSKKIQGRKTVGGQSSFIPLKVNTGGVIPIIFAQSIMEFPVVICTLLSIDGGTGIGGKILNGLQQRNWCNPSDPVLSIGLAVYLVLVIVFAYFYTSITFNPLEIADNMKKQGGFIPGIRPGKPTSEYLTKILNYIVFIGAVGLSICAVVPIFFNGVFKANVSFGGTSIIIIVGVVIETIKQIESKMVVRYYKGFLSE